MVQRVSENGGEGRPTHANRVPHTSGDVQGTGQATSGVYRTFNVGQSPTEGASSSHVPGPPEGSKVLPACCQGDVDESRPDGPLPVHGASEIPLQERDRGGSKGQDEEPGSSHRWTGFKRAPGISRHGGGERAGRTQHLDIITVDATERNILAMIIRKTTTAPGLEVDVPRIISTVQRIMNMEKFKQVEMINLTEDDSFEDFVKILLLNCIGNERRENAEERAMAALCYFLIVHKLSEMEEQCKDKLLLLFVNELRRYNIPWPCKTPKRSNLYCTLNVIINAFCLIYTCDVNRIAT